MRKQYNVYFNRIKKRRYNKQKKLKIKLADMC